MKLFHERTSPQPDAATSRTEAATPASVSSPFAKDGRLSDFNIDAFLEQVRPGCHQKLKPDNPAYYLALVGDNEPIKSALRNLRHFHEQIEVLCESIDRGEWGEVSHHYMKNTYPDNPELHPIRIKDMLFYAYAAGCISRAEFNTAHTLLDAREQFLKEIQPEYTYKVDKKKKKITLNTWGEEVEIFKIYEEDGSLTDEGYSCIDTIAENLAILQKEYDILENFDKAEWFEKIEQAFCKLPENLQVFLAIENTLPSLEEDLQKNPYAFDAWWQNQICPEGMPLMACAGDYSNATKSKRNVQIYSPSSGMLFAFLDLICPGEYVQPVVCLGTVSGRLLAKLHSEGFHPVTARDDRSSSNYIFTHGVPTGAFYASTHDALIHCFAASLFFPWQRTLYCRTIPGFIDEALESSLHFEKYFAERLIEALADLALFQYRKWNPLRFILGAANNAAQRRIPWKDQDTQRYKEACLAFTEKLFQKVKLLLLSKTQNINWQPYEDLFKEWAKGFAEQKGGPPRKLRVD